MSGSVSPTSPDALFPLVRVLETIAATDSPVDDFLAGLSGAIAAWVQSDGAVVWMSEAAGWKVRVANLEGQERRSLETIASPPLAKILSDVCQSGVSAVIPEGGPGGAPLRTSLVIPLRPEGEKPHAFQVVVTGRNEDTCRELIRWLRGMVQQVTTSRAQRKTSGRSDSFFESLEPFILALGRSLRTRDVSTVAANDGRALLNCDRVSVLERRGRRVRTLAVSGQAYVHRRSPVIRSLERLARSVLRQRDSLVFSGGEETIPADLAKLLSDYLIESNARVLLIVPLIENEPEIPASEREKQRNRRPAPVIGGIVFEQIRDGDLSELFRERCELLSRHVASALTLARTHEQIFLRPLWAAIGRWKDGLLGWPLVRTAIFLGLAAALAWILIFVPWRFRIDGVGQLMPARQQNVFAPWDGEIVELAVQTGHTVSEGQPLLRIKNHELTAQVLSLQNQILEKEQLIAALDAQIDESTKSPDRNEEVKVRGQREQARVELVGLKTQHGVLKQRESELLVRAERAGVVVTFQVQELLLRRPVRRGELLLEIMDDTGPWRLELKIPERHIGHLREAQGQAESLPVEFVLGTRPDTTWTGTLDRLATRTSTSEDGEHIVEAYASIGNDVTDRRIGADVRAKIDCGHRSLGYVLFGDAIDFVRRRVFW